MAQMYLVRCGKVLEWTCKINLREKKKKQTQTNQPICDSNCLIFYCCFSFMSSIIWAFCGMLLSNRQTYSIKVLFYPEEFTRRHQTDDGWGVGFLIFTVLILICCSQYFINFYLAFYFTLHNCREGYGKTVILVLRRCWFCGTHASVPTCWDWFESRWFKCSWWQNSGWVKSERGV